jgi:hypothetical protein
MGVNLPWEDPLLDVLSLDQVKNQVDLILRLLFLHLGAEEGGKAGKKLYRKWSPLCSCATYPKLPWKDIPQPPTRLLQTRLGADTPGSDLSALGQARRRWWQPERGSRVIF